MTDLNKYTFDTSGGSSATMVRLDGAGNVIETESERIPYDPIPKGSYVLEITGFQAPFEMPRPAQFAREEWQSETVTKTRIEFTVIDGEHAGKQFLCLYTLSFNDRATLGKLLRAILQGPLPPRFNMTKAIGMTFTATVVHSRDKNTGAVKLGRDGNPFPDIVIDTIEPFDAPGVPDELQSPKKAPGATKPADMTQDPRISWSALWAFAGRWGFNGIKDVEKAVGKDLTPFGCSEIYDMILELTNSKVA